jgi:hypothetical protein
VVSNSHSFDLDLSDYGINGILKAKAFIANDISKAHGLLPGIPTYELNPVHPIIL